MVGAEESQPIGFARARAPAETREASPVSRRERDLLCALSYVHLACGQSAQGVALLRLIEPDAIEDVGLLRILAYGLIAEGAGEEALMVLDRLDALDDQPGARLPLTLMRSHALRRAGRMDEARAAFQSYVALRAGAAETDAPEDFR